MRSPRFRPGSSAPRAKFSLFTLAAKGFYFIFLRTLFASRPWSPSGRKSAQPRVV